MNVFFEWREKKENQERKNERSGRKKRKNGKKSVHGGKIYHPINMCT
jgi:hypothetical protein